MERSKLMVYGYGRREFGSKYKREKRSLVFYNEVNSG
jgi:hypothetical protein